MMSQYSQIWNNDLIYIYIYIFLHHKYCSQVGGILSKFFMLFVLYQISSRISRNFMISLKPRDKTLFFSWITQGTFLKKSPLDAPITSE